MEAGGGGAGEGAVLLFGKLVAGNEGLHGVALGAFDRLVNLPHLFVGVDGFDDGGAEFIIGGLGADEVDGALDFSKVWKPDKIRVGTEAAFDVHGDIVDEREAFGEALRIGAVGVELDGEAEALLEEAD